MWGRIPFWASLNIGYWHTDTREAWALSSTWMDGALVGGPPHPCHLSPGLGKGLEPSV